MILLSCADFFNIFKKFFQEHYLNGLDPDHEGHFIGPDLGPNCLQSLSVDDKSCC